MKTDLQLKKDVNAELEFAPSINATQIGVAVKDGVVTLTGHLDSYAEKSAAKKAVMRVSGVRAIALELDVKLDPGHKRSDSEIAAAAETAFKWHALIPADRIQVVCEKGWVTLKGEVDWDYQRDNAERTTRSLTGVVGVTNSITLKPAAMLSDVATRIKAALVRHADDEAKKIDVIISGKTATLRGNVHSWAERSAADTAAWSAPGITSVINELKVAA
ncbi:BON domain-containing protein [Roseateles oligotrophus]|uniref:BON domain-containing protein n=1 Tax=Roseateles oligotrophus TaxID=1769250 RepID=A0ABT2YF63_9BURK|nr:BON domain-containing protein [Roseateles oligotrophus]MCV2368690.1 BON domain-containing protein [Roseateles oligotrophus]